MPPNNAALVVVGDIKTPGSAETGPSAISAKFGRLRLPPRKPQAEPDQRRHQAGDR